MGAAELTFRPFRDEDLPALLKLWETAGGWGNLTEEQWREWFIDTPHGKCIVSVAIDDQGEIHGQEVFTPARVTVGDREVRALHLSAPIVGDRLRGSPLLGVKHPVFGMFRAAVEEARAQDYQLLYGLPHRAWLMVFRLGRLIGFPKVPSTQLPCLAVDMKPDADRNPTVSLEEYERSDRYSVEFADDPAPEIGELWAESRRLLGEPVGVVRDDRWVAYRCGSHLSVNVIDRESGRVAGFASVRRDGLLFEEFARDDEAHRVTLAAAYRRLAEAPRIEGQKPPKALRAIGTKVLRPHLEPLGFEPTDFKFGFSAYPLDERIDLSDVAGDNWYVMPAD